MVNIDNAIFNLVCELMDINWSVQCIIFSVRIIHTQINLLIRQLTVRSTSHYFLNGSLARLRLLLEGVWNNPSFSCSTIWIIYLSVSSHNSPRSPLALPYGLLSFGFLPQLPSISFSFGGHGSVVILAFLHVIALAYRRVLH